MKRQAERELLCYDPADLRCVILRATAVFSEQQPQTLPIAAVAQISQAADDLLFEPLGLRQKGLTPHLVPGPAIHLSTIADAAVEAAFRQGLRGVVELPEMFRLANDSCLPELPRDNTHNR